MGNNIRQALYRCLHNEIAECDHDKIIELFSVEYDESKPYSIDISVSEENFNLLAIFNLSSGSLNNGTSEYVPYYAIRQINGDATNLNNISVKYKDTTENSVTTRIYYLYLARETTSTIDKIKLSINKNILFGTFKNLTSAISENVSEGSVVNVFTVEANGQTTQGTYHLLTTGTLDGLISLNGSTTTSSTVSINNFDTASIDSIIADTDLKVVKSGDNYKFNVDSTSFNTTLPTKINDINFTTDDKVTSDKDITVELKDTDNNYKKLTLNSNVDIQTLSMSSDTDNFNISNTKNIVLDNTSSNKVIKVNDTEFGKADSKAYIKVDNTIIKDDTINFTKDSITEADDYTLNLTSDNKKINLNSLKTTCTESGSGTASASGILTIQYEGIDDNTSTKVGSLKIDAPIVNIKDKLSVTNNKVSFNQFSLTDNTESTTGMQTSVGFTVTNNDVTYSDNIDANSQVLSYAGEKVNYVNNQTYDKNILTYTYEDDIISTNVQTSSDIILRNINAGNKAIAVYNTMSSTESPKMYVQNNGNVAAVGYYSSSDKRLKENIVDANIDYKNIINKINLKEFNFIGDNKKMIGVIAQDLQEVIPEKYNESIVATDGDYLAVNEGKLGYYTVGAVKQLIEENKQLRNEVDELKELVKKIIKKEE